MQFLSQSTSHIPVLQQKTVQIWPSCPAKHPEDKTSAGAVCEEKARAEALGRSIVRGAGGPGNPKKVAELSSSERGDGRGETRDPKTNIPAMCLLSDHAGHSRHSQPPSSFPKCTQLSESFLTRTAFTDPWGYLSIKIVDNTNI